MTNENSFTMKFSSVELKAKAKELAKSKGRSLAKEIEFLINTEISKTEK